jgi:gluconate 2-dehydrogenase gamma chain
MTESKSPTKVGRREFLGGAGVAGAAAAAATTLTPVAPAVAQQAAPAAAAASQPAGYIFLQPQEAVFIEAVVDHMIPADELTPKGTDVGIATYIDRALAGSWGKGDRLYMQGPWPRGTANQGYQLPLTPAQLYRAAIAGCDAHCRNVYKQTFARATAEQKEAFLRELSGGKITLQGGLPGPHLLRRALSERDGRHVLRPDLRRQPRQGRLEDDRLPRRCGQQCGKREAVLRRTAVHRQPRRHRRHVLREASPWRQSFPPSTSSSSAWAGPAASWPRSSGPPA